MKEMVPNRTKGGLHKDPFLYSYLIYICGATFAVL